MPDFNQHLLTQKLMQGSHSLMSLESGEREYLIGSFLPQGGFTSDQVQILNLFAFEFNNSEAFDNFNQNNSAVNVRPTEYEGKFYISVLLFTDTLPGKPLASLRRAMEQALIKPAPPKPEILSQLPGTLNEEN